MPRITSVLYVLLTGVFLAGCASGYKKHFHPISVPSEKLVQGPLSDPPRIIYSNAAPDIDVPKMYADGYTPVGWSGFVGPAAKEAGAIKQAKAIGATVIILRSKYQSTTQGVMPITAPMIQPYYMYGPPTTYVPYSIDQYDQGALYFAPMKRISLGAFLLNLTDEQRQNLGTNKALFVKAIRKDSPAFNADILPGDFLTSINDVSVSDTASAEEIITSTTGKPTSYHLIRNGKPVAISVTVPDGEW